MIPHQPLKKDRLFNLDSKPKYKPEICSKADENKHALLNVMTMFAMRLARLNTHVKL